MSTLNIYGVNTDIDHIPGNEGLPFLGNSLRYLTNPYGWSKRFRESYGEVYRSAAFYQKFVVFTTPEAAEFILRDTSQLFSNSLGWEPFLARLFPGALLVKDFEDHAMHRRIVQSAFKKPAMLGYFDSMNRLAEDSIDRWSEGEIIAYPTIKNLTLEIAASSFMGISIEKEVKAFNKAFGIVGKGLAPIIPYPVPGLALHRGIKAREYIVRFLADMLPERKGRDFSDIFTKLCNAEDDLGNKLSDTAILDHMFNIIGAAHDTMTTGLTVAIHQLAKDPALQAAAREEISQVSSISYDTLGQLPLLEAIFKEALRLYVPGPQMYRRAMRDFEFDGYQIPANTQVMLDVGYIHRSEEYWHDPLAFKPARFLGDEAESKQPGLRWMPFGGGSHMCIGLHFAIMEAKIVLWHLLSKYELSLEEGYSPKYQVLPITKPRDGLRLTLRKR